LCGEAAAEKWGESDDEMSTAVAAEDIKTFARSIHKAKENSNNEKAINMAQANLGRF